MIRLNPAGLDAAAQALYDQANRHLKRNAPPWSERSAEFRRIKRKEIRPAIKAYLSLANPLLREGETA